MRTVETEMVFRRDREAVGSMLERGHSQESFEQSHRSMHIRHAEYDDRFEHMVNQVQAMEPRSKAWARELLERLGGPHCMSGMPDFRAACDTLARLGITQANNVFLHDRQYIAATYIPAKTKEQAL